MDVPILGAAPVDLADLANKDKKEAEAQAQLALMVAQAIRLLGQVVPSWPRRDRRALANAFRQGGRGYTKSAKR